MRAVNLIPAEERRGAGGIAGRSGGVVHVLTGGLAVLVALGVVYALAVHTVAQRKGELAALVAQVATVNAEAQSLQPYVQIASISALKVQQVATLAEQRFNWPTAMAQLALALPNDVTFTSFTASVPAPGATASGTATPGSSAAAVAVGQAPFALVGCANSQGEIPGVIGNLAAVPGVTNVQLVTAVANPSLGYHKLSTALNHGGQGHSNLPNQGACPKVTWTISLSYATSYTVPKVKLPQGSPNGAQTVSTASGAKSTIVQTASQQVTP